MRKIFATICALLLGGAATLSSATGLFAPKSATVFPSLQTHKANAATAPQICTAVTDGFSVVTDDNLLYLFNEQDGGVWQTYTHTSPITHVEIDENGTAYFLDEQYPSSPLYTLNLSAYEHGVLSIKTEIYCEAFCLDGQILYYTRKESGSPWLCRVPLNNLTIEGETKVCSLPVLSKSIDIWQNELYFLYGTDYLHKLSLSSLSVDTKIADFSMDKDADTLCVVNGVFYVMSKDGTTLYSQELNDYVTPISRLTGNYSALSASDTAVYFFNGADKEIYVYQHGNTPKPAADKFPDAVTHLSTQELTVDSSPKIVKTKENALLIQIELTEDGNYPYQSAARKPSLTALQLGQTATHALLAYQTTGADGYAFYLASPSALTEQTGHTAAYPQPKTMATTNEIGLYPLPFIGATAISGLGATTRIPRGEQVTLLGETTGLADEYYHVQYGEHTGYIPKSFATEQPTPPAMQSVVLPSKGRNTDALWRLAYLILGCGAIGILVDVLLLRKKPKDED